MLRLRNLPLLPFLFELLLQPLAAQAETRVLLRLAPLRTLQVRAQADGHVSRVHVLVGDSVAAAAPLVTIANAALSTELARCDAAINEAEEQVRPNSERAAIAQLEVQIAERAAKAAALLPTDLRQDLDSIVEMMPALESQYRSSRVTTAEILDARRDARDLRRRLTEAELRAADAKDLLEIAKKHAAALAAGAAVHRCHIDALRAVREAVYARTLLLEVKSVWPKARVRRVGVVHGDVVRAGETVLCELIDTQKLTATMALTADQLRLIARGTALQLRIGDAPPLQAALRHGGVLEPDGTAQVQFDLDNEDGRWFAGQHVDAVLIHDQTERK
jgi:multidrug efflux pump subunit AcrA (membrane-fusion protein)